MKSPAARKHAGDFPLLPRRELARGPARTIQWLLYRRERLPLSTR
jgi:hypothetical protein